MHLWLRARKKIEYRIIWLTVTFISHFSNCCVVCFFSVIKLIGLIFIKNDKLFFFFYFGKLKIIYQNKLDVLLSYVLFYLFPVIIYFINFHPNFNNLIVRSQTEQINVTETIYFLNITNSLTKEYILIIIIIKST